MSGPARCRLLLLVAVATVVPAVACGGDDGGAADPAVGPGRPSSAELAEVYATHVRVPDDVARCMAIEIRGSDLPDELLRRLVDDPTGGDEDSPGYGELQAASQAAADACIEIG